METDSEEEFNVLATSSCLLQTGHSLGGALTTLAAYDFRKAARDNGVDLRVACYTFRRNHAFAKEFNAIVNDCWHVINDLVSCLPKHRFIITTPVYFMVCDELPAGHAFAPDFNTVVIDAGMSSINV